MIELLIGMIASGKSTWARQRAGQGWLVVNDDAIVTMLHGGDYHGYNQKYKALYKAVEDTILHTAVAMGKDVVIDRTNLSPASRRRWLSLGASLGVPVRGVVFQMETPEVHARRRADADGRGYSYEYWLRVARHHLAHHGPPTLDEGFAEIVAGTLQFAALPPLTPESRTAA